MNKFNELPIGSEILRAIEDCGYSEPTQIQIEAIPAILEGRDVLGKSNTGTGKTAAFGIPAIERIEPGMKMCDVLVVCPTRELVLQVAGELRKFSKYKEGVKIAPIYGGEPIDRQIQLLKKGAAIVVGTPGRIMDHLRRKTLKLSALSMMILDEADEMLNMGFKEDIEEILKSVPHDDYQMILFSATMPKAILNITEEFQDNPLRIEIASKQRTVDNVNQVYYEVPRGKKFDALQLLLQHYNSNATMIFANTKKQVDELVDELNKVNIKAIGLHGDMKQTFRSRVLEQFKAGNYPILIATDVAARGIDIDDIELVINYDIPQDNEYYIHRVGRTGRAGKKGDALTLINGNRQAKFIKDIAKYTKTNIVKQPLPSLEEIVEMQKQNYICEVRELLNESIPNSSFEIINQLLAEGYAIENIATALVSKSYVEKAVDFEIKDEEKVSTKSKDMRMIKISVGKKDQVSTNHIICTISEESGLTSNVIGKVSIRDSFTLAEVDAKYVDKILDSMSECTIKGISAYAELDERKRKKENAGRSKRNVEVKEEKSRSRRSSDKTTSRSEEKAARGRKSEEKSSRGRKSEEKTTRGRRSRGEEKTSRGRRGRNEEKPSKRKKPTSKERKRRK